MNTVSKEDQETLAEEICDYDVNSWSSMSLSLNIYQILIESMCTRHANDKKYCGSGCLGVFSPFEILLKLFELFGEYQIPIGYYKWVVGKVVPAALSKKTHQKYCGNVASVEPPRSYIPEKPANFLVDA